MTDIVTIDQFAAVVLLVGRIVSVSAVEGSRKLLLLHIDIGEANPRVILSGIRDYYTPETLTDRLCVVVSNLAPRSMMGVESNGMLLCVSYTKEGSEVVEIVEPPKQASVGSRLS